MNQLYPFQQAGVRFLGAAGSALLADEMGTGKTIQGIAYLELLGEIAYPALIVSPNTVKYVWAREFAKWAPQRRVSVAGSGTAAATKAALKVSEDEADVLIINWDALRSMSRLAGFGSEKLRGCLVCDPILRKQAEIWEAAAPGERSKVKPGAETRCERCAKILNTVEWGAVIADEAHRTAREARQPRHERRLQVSHQPAQRRDERLLAAGRRP